VLSLRGVFTVALNDLHASWSGAFLDRVSLSGVLGVARWRSTANMNVDLRGFPPAPPFAFAFQSADKRRDSGNSFTIGARVSYDVTESVRVGVAWDRYTNLGGSPAALIGQSPLPLPTLPVGAAGRGTPSVSTISTDVDVYSVQLVYRFR
jgi:opacity protein-like surface antigen